MFLFVCVFVAVWLHSSFYSFFYQLLFCVLYQLQYFQKENDVVREMTQHCTYIRRLSGSSRTTISWMSSGRKTEIYLFACFSFIYFSAFPVGVFEFEMFCVLTLTWRFDVLICGICDWIKMNYSSLISYGWSTDMIKNGDCWFKKWSKHGSALNLHSSEWPLVEHSQISGHLSGPQSF